MNAQPYLQIDLKVDEANEKEDALKAMRALSRDPLFPQVNFVLIRVLQINQ